MELQSFEGLFSAGIGEMVNPSVINEMNNFIDSHGQYAFRDAVFQGAWSSFSYAYIHPCDEIRSTKRFTIIQEAFINAYV